MFKQCICCNRIADEGGCLAPDPGAFMCLDCLYNPDLAYEKACKKFNTELLTFKERETLLSVIRVLELADTALV